MPTHQLCHVAVIERHGKNGRVAHGLLRNFGLKDGAVASTVGHDAHNLIVAGRTPSDMLAAAQAVAEGRFHVYAVATVEEGIELLTGIPAGVADASGRYAAQTVFAAVTAQLGQFHAAVSGERR